MNDWFDRATRKMLEGMPMRENLPNELREVAKDLEGYKILKTEYDNLYNRVKDAKKALDNIKLNEPTYDELKARCADYEEALTRILHHNAPYYQNAEPVMRSIALDALNRHSKPF